MNTTPPTNAATRIASQTSIDTSLVRPARDRTAPIWVPEPQTYSSWAPPSAEAETRPLPPQPVREPEPRREAPRLWTPPPGRTGHWDDDDRHRDEDDDDRPPGLWSGWANR